MRTIFDQLRLHACCAPSAPAILVPGGFVTYGALQFGMNSVQAVVKAFRIDANQPVGVLIDNPAQHLTVLLALIKSGFTVISLRAELLDRAVSLGMRVLISDYPNPQQVSRAGLDVKIVDQKWFSEAGAPEIEAPFPQGRIARILFTSGSSGVPKAIGLSFGTFQRRMTQAYAVRTGAQGRFVTTYGLSNAALYYALGVLFSGNSITFCPMGQALEAMMTIGVDELRASAVQATSLLEINKEKKYPLRIPRISTGGGQLVADVAEHLQCEFGAEITNTYMATECGHMGFAYGALIRMRRTMGNCFAPVTKVEIVDEGGALAPTGKEGRIRARSDAMGWPAHRSLMEANADKGDGWFYPGDVGYMNGQGLFVVTGRADEVINDGGVKFSPDVIEAHLRRHPEVTDAGACRIETAPGVFEPWLAVVAKSSLGHEAINAWLAATLQGELRSVQFRRVMAAKAIPRSGNGKIARQELRAMLLQLAAGS